MDGLDGRGEAGAVDGPSAWPSAKAARRSLVAVAVAVVGAAAGVEIYRRRSDLAASWQQLGVWPMVASLALGLVGVGATFPAWRSVLRGLGAAMPWGGGARVYFTSQLGKYVPGAVWPALLQMEAGRARGASRRVMLSANLVALVLGCATGLAVACLALPLSDTAALVRYGWAFIALPGLVALLHPRVLSRVLDWAARLLRRPPHALGVDPRAEGRACGWSLVSWLGLGGHVTVLCAALGPGGLDTYLLCTGGMAFAVSVGVLAVPVPAGAGVRDAILTLVLAAVLTSGQALAVAVASRAILVLCDVALAAAVAPLRRRAGALS